MLVYLEKSELLQLTLYVSGLYLLIEKEVNASHSIHQILINNPQIFIKLHVEI